jgi:hypothetical protein
MLYLPSIFFWGEISLFSYKEIENFLDFLVVLNVNLIIFSLFFGSFHQNFDVKKRKKKLFATNNW